MSDQQPVRVNVRKHDIIADILKQVQLAGDDDIARAREVQARDGGTLVGALVAAGRVSEEQAFAAIATGLRLEFLARDPGAAASARAQLPEDFCRDRRVVALDRGGHGLRLAMSDPLDYRTVQDVEFRTGRRVTPVVVSDTTMRGMLARLGGAHVVDDKARFELVPDIEPTHVAEPKLPDPVGEVRATQRVIPSITPDPTSLLGRPGDKRRTEQAIYDLIGDIEPAGMLESSISQDDSETSASTARAPIIKLVNVILSEAARVGASDVHIEPQAQHLQVRRRIDGILEDVMRVPQTHQAAVLSRLKLIASMDISERRRPQDGRAVLRIGPDHVDLRVSSLPTQFGEKIVIRLLDTRTAKFDMEQLGFDADNAGTLRALLNRPQGMILVTGPTGSGKTSTLYAALNCVRSPSKNIITVEDPVEYQLPGVNQVPINARAGVTFAAGLRSILRQDPNVVMVGEIRDTETADIALEAAQTGHLVLSTLHTNDAPGTITRLLDLGVEPFLIASSLLAVLAQRLVRRPCAACAIAVTPGKDELAQLGGAARVPSDARWKAGVGCPACGGTGYKGRVAVHELLVVNPELRSLISRRAPEDELREAARRAGMRTLTVDAIGKAARGLTTVSEIVRAIPPDSVAPEPAPSIDRARAGGASPTIGAAPRIPDRVPASESGVSVLVVEDSAMIAAVVRYYLELEGFRVLTATDGVSGLEMAQREHPDAIVADIEMPGMDGITMVRELRASPETDEIAVLMLTGADGLDAETEAMAAGADAYLLKPVEPRRLAAHVRAMLKRSRRAPGLTGTDG